jgi:hypothetical protein
MNISMKTSKTQFQELMNDLTKKTVEGLPRFPPLRRF